MVQFLAPEIVIMGQRYFMGKEVLTVEYVYSLRIETIQDSSLDLAVILPNNGTNLL